VPAVSTTVPARTGLVGHPSDGFGGAVLAAPLPQVAATVTVAPATSTEITVGDRRFGDLAGLLAAGHHGESKLLTAAAARLAAWLPEPPPAAGFTMTWDTTIPRSVGLAGSSALVVGALRSLAGHWGVTIPDTDGPRLALEVETDLLGIAAGPQDRAVQWHGTTVLVDAGTTPWRVEPVRAPRPVGAFLCWTAAGRQPSQRTHGPLQRRRDEPELRRRMAALATLARDAAAALRAGDLPALRTAIDAGFEHRRAVVPLDPAHVELVEGLRALGAAATYAGSGGAVVAVVDDEGPLRRWAASRGLGHLSTTFG
jgi:glucuronokinase